VGQRLLGTGHALGVSGLLPATQTITLTAKDYLGRTASVSVTVNVVPLGRPPTTAQADPIISNPNLVLWLSADTGLDLDTSGHVLAWSDLSGLGHDASQTDPTARPLFVPNGPPGGPVVRFGADGNDYLNLAGQVLTSPQFSIIAILNDVATNTNPLQLFSNYADSGGTNAIFFGVHGRNPTRAHLSGDFEASTSAGILSTQAVVGSPARFFSFAAVVRSTALGGRSETAIFQNGHPIAAASTPAITRKLTGPYVIGRQGTSTADQYWRGDVAELLVYKTALSSNELLQVQNYLLSRYPVLPIAPRMQSIQAFGNLIQMICLAPSYSNYQVQYASSFEGPWLTLTNLHGFPTNSQFLVTDTSTAPQRFYRLATTLH
jgi:hypothetical protein